MADNNDGRLLDYYERELSYMRRMGSAFAARYPKIAARLELSDDESPDPHVERLIESFSFLSGRINYNIESEFPQFTNALLGTLYPQFIDPIPSMTIAEFQVDPLRGKITTGYEIPKGTPLFTESSQGPTVRFRSSYPVTLWPLEVIDARLEPIQDVPGLPDLVPRALSVLRIKLKVEGGPMTDLEFSKLRFYLQGERRETYGLYDLLFGSVEAIALLSDRAEQPQLVPKAKVLPVGLGIDEGVLPYPSHSHYGYRLLQEYFTFPQKYLFFDLDGIHHGGASQVLEIQVALNSFVRSLQTIGPENFRLGCTPIINLFKKTTEPIRMDHKKSEYRLVPDSRREPFTEIHSIQKVTASSIEEEKVTEFANYFSFTHKMKEQGQRAFYNARRVETARRDLSGTDIMLSFVNLAGDHTALKERTVFAHTLCTNRGLAQELPGSAYLDIELAAPVSAVVALHKPTPQIQPPLGGSGLWRLVSHLSVNHLSLTGGAESLEAMQELLRLHAMSDDPFIHRQINGITKMETRRVARRIGDVSWAFSRGTEVVITFDAEDYARNSYLLLANVLNRFLALYATINSFTELAVKLEQREEVVKRWPPMIGEQPAL